MRNSPLALSLVLLLASLPTIGQDREPSPLHEPAETALPAPPSVEEAARALEEVGLDRLRVEAAAGAIEVSGTVVDNGEREAALAVVREAVAPLPVEDRMRLDTSFEARLAPAVQRVLELSDSVLAWLPLLLVAGLIVWLARFIGRWLSRRRWVARLGRGNPYLADLARRAVSWTSLAIGLLLALELLDLTAMAGALLGAAGVVGIAMGFAFKDIIENHLAGILLSLRQPFAPGDHLTIDGHEGRIVGLTARATLLMTLDGNHLRIPNSRVFNAVILNFSRNPLRRFQFDLGVGPSDDLVAAQQLGVAAIASSGLVSLEREPRASLLDLGDSSVVVRFTGWVDQREHDFTAVRSACLLRVKESLEARGISLPEPHYRILLDGGSAVPEPGRPAALPGSPPAESRVPVSDASQLPSSPANEVEGDLLQERDQLGDANLLRPGRDD